MADKRTLWKLLTNAFVRIPDLQREYAQGRENTTVKAIRENLVDKLFDSLNKSSPLVLNFVYGVDSDSKTFTPIDGQQRLTTLYLLHWYIFYFSKDQDGIDVLKKFSYETRTSTKAFCKELCQIGFDELTADFDIKKQISQYYWFTGNLYADPSVRSMLVMLEAIRKKFAQVDTDKISDMAKALKSDDCPINFFYMSMSGYPDEGELYIKMNARGKPLSPFEIFKAKLQGSELLALMLGGASRASERADFIGKYNNQYAEYFYEALKKLCADKENKEKIGAATTYDDGMMRFIVTMVRDTYFSWLSQKAGSSVIIRQETRFENINGSVFFFFLENAAAQIYDIAQENGVKAITDLNHTDLDAEVSQMIVSALQKTDVLFDAFANKSFLHGGKYDLEEILYKRVFFEKDDGGNFGEIICYALMMFLYYAYKNAWTLDRDVQEAYIHYNNYLYRLMENSRERLKNVENMADMLRFTESFVETLFAAKPNVASVYKLIADTKTINDAPAFANLQQVEETVKARLWLNSSAWQASIDLAQNYFKNGTIGFLLYACCTPAPSGIDLYSYMLDSNNYDSAKFDDFFEVSKLLLDSEFLTKIPDALVERALLCIKDADGTGYMSSPSNSTKAWDFSVGKLEQLLVNEKNSHESKRAMFVELLYYLRGKTSIEAELKNKIKATLSGTFFDDINNKWKRFFVEENRFDKNLSLSDYHKFYNCVYLSDDKKDVLLLSSTSTRGYNQALEVVRLSLQLQLKGISARLIAATTDTIAEDSKPLRYAEINGMCVGYMNGGFVWWGTEDIAISKEITAMGYTISEIA